MNHKKMGVPCEPPLLGKKKSLLTVREWLFLCKYKRNKNRNISNILFCNFAPPPKMALYLGAFFFFMSKCIALHPPSLWGRGMIFETACELMVLMGTSWGGQRDSLLQGPLNVCDNTPQSLLGAVHRVWWEREVFRHLYGQHLWHQMEIPEGQQTFRDVVHCTAQATTAPEGKRFVQGHVIC